MVTVEKILEVSAYLTKIHHVKGRIRVRVNPKIKNQANGVTIEDIESLPKKIKGIKSVKINKVVGSITVMYDNDVFPHHLWDDLLEQKNLNELSHILNDLAKEVA